MKQLILLVLCALPAAVSAGQAGKCCANAAAAAEAFYSPSVREQLRQAPAAITSHSLTLAGDSLVVAFEAEIPARYIRPGEAYVLTPVLTAFNETEVLPPLSVEGRHYYLVIDDCPCIAKVRYDGTVQRVSYRRTIPATVRNRYAGLRIEATRRWACASKDAEAAAGTPLDTPGNEPDLSAFAGKTQILYFIPAPYTDSDAYVNDFGGKSVFRIDETTVDRRVFDPAMKEVTESYTRIGNDPASSIHAIDVRVASSPDGRYAYNEYLAQARARNIRTHLAGKFSDADLERMKVTAEAENWEAFRKALPASEIEDKAAVERILRDYADPDEREAALRKLPEWPAVRRIFDRSRNCRIEISYDILRSPATGEELIETRLNAPSGYITPEEAARIAELDSSAAHLNNLMVAWIVAGEYDKALACAGRIADEQLAPAIANNKAVLCDLTGKPSEAEAYFRQAAVPAAAYNRGVMALNAGDEIRAAELLEPSIEK